MKQSFAPTPQRTMLALGLAAAVSLGLAACAPIEPSPTEPVDTSIPAPTADGGTLNHLLPNRISEKNVLKVGTAPVSIPCEYIEDGQLKGIGVDMWNAVANHLGVKVDVIAVEFASLIPGIQAGRFDVAEQCIADNKTRQEVVSFVDYMTIHTVVVIPSANPHKIEGARSETLCGLKVAVLDGSNYIGKVENELNPVCTENGLEPLEIVKLPDQGQVLLAAQSGRVDFAMTNSTAGAFMSDAARDALTLVPVEALHPSTIGFVVAKDDVELQEALLAAFKLMHETGEYIEILERWHLDPESDAIEPGINISVVP